jgi:hypothetical protein
MVQEVGEMKKKTEASSQKPVEEVAKTSRLCLSFWLLASGSWLLCEQP